MNVELRMSYFFLFLLFFACDLLANVIGIYKYTDYVVHHTEMKCLHDEQHRQRY